VNTMLSEVFSETEFEAIRSYYRDPDVRARINEFCGGKVFSCEYMIGFGEQLRRRGYRKLLILAEQAELPELMENGLDIFRSVWDKKATLAVWDVEYFNLDTWSDLYRHQLDYFEMMEPTYTAIENVLRQYAIPHINDCTSSGYHFISEIPFSSPVHKRLEGIGHLEKSLREKYALVPGGDNKRKRPVPDRDGKAYSGIGRLIEFLCHRVIRQARGESPLEITISDAATGRSPRGREGMSLDITQYGDPLYMRDIRTSFSTHQKHKVHVKKVGLENGRALPVQATVPRNELSFFELFEIRKDLERAAEYAAQNRTAIPDAGEGWERVLEDYLASPLYSFHREFDAVEQEPPSRWPETYWKLNLDSLPPCAAKALRNAKQELIIPTNLQNICRIFFALGWHPKHIAGLIRSYYKRDLGWYTDWTKYDPQTRANFWARVYCGLLIDGLDSLKDFNCASQAEKGICPHPGCGYDLDRLRDAVYRRL